MKKARAQKKEGIIKSHAQNRTTGICNMLNRNDNNKDKKSSVTEEAQKDSGRTSKHGFHTAKETGSRQAERTFTFGANLLFLISKRQNSKL